jgi:hypothetical protein
VLDLESFLLQSFIIAKFLPVLPQILLHSKSETIQFSFKLPSTKRTNCSLLPIHLTFLEFTATTLLTRRLRMAHFERQENRLSSHECSRLNLLNGGRGNWSSLWQDANSVLQATRKASCWPSRMEDSCETNVILLAWHGQA